ncbi:MAG TPA: hypothetical protein VLI39_14195 [Sedimentisphaerales bacterium]|nr:hypothetical protein [Sedimentisphaerales bacterium]
MATERTRIEDRQVMEIAVKKVTQAIGHYTLAFQRRVLAEALRRIPAAQARAEALEIGRQIDVLCGRRPGLVAGVRIPEDLRC